MRTTHGWRSPGVPLRRADGSLVRISIGQDGFDDNGNAGRGGASITPEDFDHAGPARSDPTMSNDGAFVFFESPVGLTPQALNDAKLEHTPPEAESFAENVYEWHEGRVYLISDGRDIASNNGGSAVRLIGSDESGANVFFSTTDKLLPSDTDTQLDFYDARICEPERGNPCIQPAPPPLSPCLGEACHGIPPGSPLPPNVPTSTFNGQGNLVQQSPPPPTTQTRARKLAAALKACHKHRRRKRRARCERNAHARYSSARRAERAGRPISTGRTGR